MFRVICTKITQDSHDGKPCQFLTGHKVPQESRPKRTIGKLGDASGIRAGRPEVPVVLPKAPVRLVTANGTVVAQEYHAFEITANAMCVLFCIYDIECDLHPFLNEELIVESVSD